MDSVWILLIFVAIGVVAVGVLWTIDRSRNRRKPARSRPRKPRRGGAPRDDRPRPFQVPEGFRLLRNLETQSGHIDGVVVGPTGVYVLVFNDTPGRVSSRNNTLYINGKPQPNGVKGVKDRAQWVRKQLAQAGVQVQPVPVLLFRRAFVEARRPVMGVWVVSSSYLERFVQKEREPLQASEIQRIYEVLKGLAQGVDNPGGKA